MEHSIQDFTERVTSEPPKEGLITKSVENVTAKIPSMAWLWLALGAMAVSAGIAVMSEKKSTANFVGLWAPSLLLIGIYNKLVKLEGNDRFRRPESALH